MGRPPTRPKGFRDGFYIDRPPIRRRQKRRARVQCALREAHAVDCNMAPCFAADGDPQGHAYRAAG